MSLPRRGPVARAGSLPVSRRLAALGVAGGVMLGLWSGCRSGSVAHEAPPPQPRAHAHNDYEHPRPLLDALAQGFCSVEADVHLVGDQLLVAHDLDQVSPERTLQRLYLDPLQARVRRHGGRVHPGGPLEFTLLVDIKSEAEPTYRVLEQILTPAYEGMLTRFGEDGTQPGAVTVILSGNRPTGIVSGQARRWVGIDGRLPDLQSDPPVSLVPLISDRWDAHFAWNGEGDFSAPQRRRLEAWVGQAHRQGRRIRFWAVPDRPEAWSLLIETGVDLINTDRLEGLATHLRSMDR